MMTDKQIERMVKAIVGTLDYDQAKDLDPRTAEEPEQAEKLLASLVEVARHFIPKRPPQAKRSPKR